MSVAATAANRIAGQNLGKFLNLASNYLSSKAADATLDYLTKKAPAFAESKGPQRFLSNLDPKKTSKVVGAVAPVAAASTAAVGLAGLASSGQTATQSGYSLPVQRGGTPVSFANQAYVPGYSPMTNAAMADAFLEQQKFNHQLQLIQAREQAQNYSAPVSRSMAQLDPMSLANQIFQTPQY